MKAILTSVRRHLTVVLICISLIISFPGGAVVRNPSANAKDATFNPWVGKISWNRKWQPTPVFLLEKFNGQRTLQAIVHRVTESAQPRTSVITGDAKRLFTCFLAIGDVSSLEKCLFRSGFFASLILSWMNCLGTLEVNPLTVTSFPDIFSHSVGCLFCSVYGLLHC